MKTHSAILTMLLSVFIACSLQAQEWKDLAIDDLYAVARKEVFDGNSAGGQEKLMYILEKNPGYDEVKIFLARTYAWDGLFDSARTALREILERNTNHADALDALIDVELWSNNYDVALQLTQKGLAAYPNNENYLFKHATALKSFDRNDEALIILNKLLQINPAHERGTDLFNNVKSDSRKYTAAVIWGADFFNKVFKPATFVSAQLSRTNSWGSSHIKLNYAQRFSIEGLQFETDLYPRISDRIYAYLNFGYSESPLFPENRMGAEMFLSYPKTWRHLLESGI